jgi:hypothetical protein
MEPTNCLLTAGLQIGCLNNLGGIQTLYFRNYSASTVYTYDATDSITGSTNTAAPYYTFNIRMESGEFMQKGHHSIPNGTNFWEQTVNFQAYKYQASVRNLLMTMAYSQLDCIVLDQNGTYFQLFEQNGGNVSATEIEAGKAFGDLNGGKNITVKGNEPTPARVATAGYIATLTIV